MRAPLPNSLVRLGRELASAKDTGSPFRFEGTRPKGQRRFFDKAFEINRKFVVTQLDDALKKCERKNIPLETVVETIILLGHIGNYVPNPGRRRQIAGDHGFSHPSRRNYTS